MLTLLFNQAQSGGGSTLSLTGIASAEAFGTFTISAAIALPLAGIASAEAFGAASYSKAVALALTGIASSEAFGTVTYTAGGVAFPLTGIVSAEAFGAATVASGSGSLSLTGIPSAEAFGVLQFFTESSISATGIASAEAFGIPNFSEHDPLFLVGIPSTEAFGTALFSSSASLIVSGIASGEAFGSPSCSTNFNEALTGIGSAEAFGIITFRGSKAARITIFPNGQILTSMAITPQALNSLLQTLTCQMLGIDPSSDPLAYSKVRLEWPQQGQPGFGISDDICFLRVVEEDDAYNRIRDRQFGTQSGSYGSTDTYTRVWRVSWCLYGPNSFDNARLIKSALFSADFTHDTLAGQHLYLVTDVPATRRNPEKYQNQWWDRSDIDIRLNELITETLTLNAITSAEILVFTNEGEVEDVTATTN